MAVAMAMGMPTSSCSVMASPVLTSFCLPNSQNVSSLPFPRARVRVHTLSLSFSTMAKTTSPDSRRERIIIRPQTPTQTPTKSNPLPVGLTRNLTTRFAVSTATPAPTTTPTEARAVGRYIPMSAHKARRVIDQIRGRSYADALMILELMPYRACYPILKLVYSAAANAKHNMGLNEGSLIVSKAEVNEGNTVKKLKPQARGRGFPIRRYSCHITVVLKDVDLEEKYYDSDGGQKDS